MHNNANNSEALTQFLEAAMRVKPKAEHPSVVRERERQEALRAKGERVSEWREYAAQPHEPLPDEHANGESLRQLRERAGLSLGEVSEIASVSPADVQSFEAGRQTYCDGRLQHVAAAIRDALNAQKNRAR